MKRYVSEKIFKRLHRLKTEKNIDKSKDLIQLHIGSMNLFLLLKSWNIFSSNGLRSKRFALVTKDVKWCLWRPIIRSIILRIFYWKGARLRRQILECWKMADRTSVKIPSSRRGQLFVVLLPFVDHVRSNGRNYRGGHLQLGRIAKGRPKFLISVIFRVIA